MDISDLNVNEIVLYPLNEKNIGHLILKIDSIKNSEIILELNDLVLDNCETDD